MNDLKNRFIKDFKKSSVYIRNMTGDYSAYWLELYGFYNKNHGSNYWSAVLDAAEQCGCKIDLTKQ